MLLDENQQHQDGHMLQSQQILNDDGKSSNNNHNDIGHSNDSEWEELMGKDLMMKVCVFIGCCGIHHICRTVIKLITFEFSLSVRFVGVEF
jgi:hypothetical protein